MELIIRREYREDYAVVFKLIEKAFMDDPMSDHKEQYLVERLRKSEAFVPELSMVAEVRNEIIGYILLIKVKIKDEDNEFTSLALAPVCVRPDFQKQGVGANLIIAAHKNAKCLGFKSVVLLGHENYYPKFGYVQADSYSVQFPAEFPKQNCMLIELAENGLKDVKGLIHYPKEFYE